MSAVSFGAVAEAVLSIDCTQTIRQLPSTGPGLNLNYWADNKNVVPTLQINAQVRLAAAVTCCSFP